MYTRSERATDCAGARTRGADLRNPCATMASTGQRGCAQHCRHGDHLLTEMAVAQGLAQEGSERLGIKHVADRTRELSGSRIDRSNPRSMNADA